MCEFCHKHGEGKKWYLKAENYSDDLLSDLKRRRFTADFFCLAKQRPGGLAKLGKILPMPGFVRSVLVPYRVGRQQFSRILMSTSKIRPGGRPQRCQSSVDRPLGTDSGMGSVTGALSQMPLRFCNWYSR